MSVSGLLTFISISMYVLFQASEIKHFWTGWNS